MKNSFKILYSFLLSGLMVLSISSCKKDSTGGIPTIDRVRLVSKTDTLSSVNHRITLDSNSVYDETRVVPFDSTVTIGRLNTQYAILGSNLRTTKSISINGVSIYFNPGLVTDHSIIVTLPSGLPFGPNQTNLLTVVTKFGSVDYPFGVLQPPPIITSFDPLAAGPGTIVTIKGSVFDDVSEVRFDDIPAEIVGTPTKTEIQVKVPVGVVQAYIYVTTPGGTTKSPAAFGFKVLVYDDAFTSGWPSYSGYNSVLDFANTEHPKRGTNAIKVTFNNNYGALQVGYNGATISTSGLSAIKFSIYGDPSQAGKKVQVVINGNYGNAFLVDLSAGSYTDYTIPLSSLGNPATITELVFQAYGLDVPSVIYVDDIGFI